MLPTVFLMCGLPGSGKTTYANKIEKDGILRLSLDEELFKRFGREFESGLYDKYETETKEALKEVLVSKIKITESIILDYGFWKKSDRDEYKHIVEDAGGRWKLLYFKVDTDTLRDRLKARNETNLVQNHLITDEMLDTFINEFEPPLDEGEEIVG